MLTLDPTLKKKIGWGATDPNPKRNMVMDINRTTGSIHLHGVAGLGGGESQYIRVLKSSYFTQ